MYLRLQSCVYLSDLNEEFLEAYLDTIAEHGACAGSCFGLGA